MSDEASEAASDEPVAPPVKTAAQRRSLWVTSWGVVLAASTAFSLGYGASRRADPSVGASRPPGWPLIISLLVVAVSLWFVLAPRLHQWPFKDGPAPPSDAPPSDAPPSDAPHESEPELADLTESEER